MGDDEAALVRLWREKRGEVEQEDLSGNLIVQLGVATEERRGEAPQHRPHAKPACGHYALQCRLCWRRAERIGELAVR